MNPQRQDPLYHYPVEQFRFLPPLEIETHLDIDFSNIPPYSSAAQSDDHLTPHPSTGPSDAQLTPSAGQSDDHLTVHPSATHSDDYEPSNPHPTSPQLERNRNWFRKFRETRTTELGPRPTTPTTLRRSHHLPAPATPAGSTTADVVASGGDAQYTHDANQQAARLRRLTTRLAGCWALSEHHGDGALRLECQVVLTLARQLEFAQLRAPHIDAGPEIEVLLRRCWELWGRTGEFEVTG